MIIALDIFGCGHCAGMGYTDYPSCTKPCPVPGHLERHQANERGVRVQMEAMRRDWVETDGPCPYCKETGNCPHWTGLGWSKDSPPDPTRPTQA